MFWSLAWHNWLARNVWISEGKAKDPQLMIFKVVSLVGEYERAMKNQEVRRPDVQLTTRWYLPSAGVYKINFDAAFSFYDGEVGFRGIIRDHVGDEMVATCCRFWGS